MSINRAHYRLAGTRGAIWKEEILTKAVSGAKLTESSQPQRVVFSHNHHNHMTHTDMLQGVNYAEQRHADWRRSTTCETPAMEPRRRGRSVLMT